MKTKKLISLLLAMAVAVTMLSGLNLTVSASVEPASEDLILGDFSSMNEGKAYSVDNWGENYGNHSDNMQTEITRVGKDMALKWDYFTNGTADTNPSNAGLNAPFNTRLKSPNFTVGDLIKYHYVNVWMYSKVANSQVLNLYLPVTGLGGNWPDTVAQPRTITVDWTGWKLVTIPYGDWTMDSFAGTDTTASTTVYFQMQGSGYKVDPLIDTELYVDSIWLSETAPVTSTPVSLGTKELYRDYSNPTASADTQPIFIEPASGDKVYATANGITYNDNAASVIMTPSRKNTSGSYDLWWGRFNTRNNANFCRTFDSSERETLYINFVVKQNVDNGQQFSVYFGGTNSGNHEDGSALKNSRYEKSGLTLEGTDWQILSVKISELQDIAAGNDAYLRVWNDTTKITDVALCFPSYSGTKNDTTIKNDTVFYIDSVWFSDYDMSASVEPTIVGAENNETVSSAFGGVGFKFPKELSTDSNAYNNLIEVKKGENVINTGYTVQTEGDTLYVKNAGLEPGANYTVTYKGGCHDYITTAEKSVSFSTSEAHYDLTASHTDETHNTITDLPESGKVLVKARLTNATAEATSARIIAVICDATTGNFESAVMGDAVNVGIGKSANLSITVNLTSYAGKKIKTFVWEDDTLKPYSSTIAEID